MQDLDIIASKIMNRSVLNIIGTSNLRSNFFSNLHTIQAYAFKGRIGEGINQGQIDIMDFSIYGKFSNSGQITSSSNVNHYRLQVGSFY